MRIFPTTSASAVLTGSRGGAEVAGEGEGAGEGAGADPALYTGHQAQENAPLPQSLINLLY